MKPEVYCIESVGDITTIRFLKAPNAEEVRRAVDDVAENSPTCLRLWDLTCGGFTQTGIDLKGMGEYGKTKQFPLSKVAIVAPKNLAYGLSRMFTVYREDNISNHKVFRTEEEALTWLKSK